MPRKIRPVMQDATRWAGFIIIKYVPVANVTMVKIYDAFNFLRVGEISVKPESPIVVMAIIM